MELAVLPTLPPLGGRPCAGAGTEPGVTSCCMGPAVEAWGPPSRLTSGQDTPPAGSANGPGAGESRSVPPACSCRPGCPWPPGLPPLWVTQQSSRWGHLSPPIALRFSSIVCFPPHCPPPLIAACMRAPDWGGQRRRHGSRPGRRGILGRRAVMCLSTGWGTSVSLTGGWAGGLGGCQPGTKGGARPGLRSGSNIGSSAESGEGSCVQCGRPLAAPWGRSQVRSRCREASKHHSLMRLGQDGLRLPGG